MARSSKKAAQDPSYGQLTLRPGWLITNTSSATGGVKYDRQYISESRDGEQVNSEFLTKKKVDNEKIVKEIDALAKRADYICRANCANTAIGWIADEAALIKIGHDFEELRENAAELNRMAESFGSRHRAHINYVPTFLDVSNPQAAEEIARTVRESLLAIYAALRAGDVSDTKFDGKVTRRAAFRPAVLRANNLEKLAVGLTSEFIKEALKTADIAKKTIAAMIESGTPHLVAGKSVDLEAIEVAINCFGGVLP
jgi:hypothetical protein